MPSLNIIAFEDSTALFPIVSHTPLLSFLIILSDDCSPFTFKLSFSNFSLSLHQTLIILENASLVEKKLQHK